jgi:hypothetical protein
MSTTRKKAFNQRVFVSVGLLMTATVLVITAIIIQVFEALEDNFVMHLFFVAHIFTGVAFSVLAAMHANINWESIDGYIGGGELTFSREVRCAALLTVGAVIAGFLFVCLVMY